MINKEKILISISIFLSLAIHVVAIGFVNNIPIRSFAASKILSFSDQNSSLQKRAPKEIVNFVFSEKKSKRRVLNGVKTLPSNEGIKEISSEIKVNAIDVKDNLNFDIVKNEIKPNLKEIKPTLPEIEKSFYAISPTLINNLKTSIKLENQNSEKKLSPEKETEKSVSFFDNKKQNSYHSKENKFFQTSIDNDSLIKEMKIVKLNKFSSIFASYPPLLSMPSLEELSTLSCKDFFNVDIIFTPQEGESGFVFAITLVPKANLKLQKMKQNIFFIVDRSNSIQQDRLNATRHAIISSLNNLEKSDTFNIIAFDTKIDLLSQTNLQISSSSISQAKNFLSKQTIGSFFSSTNYSIPLYKVLNNNVKNDEINIAILISNGDGLNKSKNLKTLNDWTKLNKGNLSLYTLSLESDKNKSLLELFSNLNKGKQLVATNNKGLKRKLQKLVKSLNYPIAKNLTPSVICLEDSNIKLYPAFDHQPNLYLDEPYVILGTCDKLKDFTIFLQGNSKEHDFNLKKHILFENGKQGDFALNKELALKKASMCYEMYISDNNPTHLLEAKKHLAPFDLHPIIK